MPTLYSRTGHTQVDKAVRSAPVSVADTLAQDVAAPDAGELKQAVSQGAPPEVQPDLDTEPELTPENSADVASQQTQFAEDLSIEGYTSQGPVLAPTETEEVVPFWKKHKLLLLASGLALMVIFTLAMMMPRSNEMDPNIVVTPTPTTEAQQALSVLQRELILLEKDIEQADPLQAKLAFPPVNFTLELDDATTLEQNQRSPLR